ncbi:porin [Haemophilus influenzae]|uniref:porin n=1 Tax=Haemophilus influenzae TaxID=727 RepID=UPI000D0174AA|nr:porin [Haemophilus influenzae]NXZ84956.1 porin [Haemophilus influenzae]PRM15755.1 Outer membrane porin protein precursor [Haemophilus influenzae]
MKKTLAALIIGAFAASAANAAVVYDKDGSKVEIGGSVRLLLEKTNKGGEANKHTHSGLKNAGSRLEVKAKHNLENGYYALGQLQIRLDGKQSAKPTKDDKFGALSTKRAFIGLGHKEFGEVRFGRQVTFADSLYTAKDRSYGILETGEYIPTDGNSVVRYIYKGVEGVEIGADYLFADDRDADNEVKIGTLQNAFQVGTSYEKDGVIAKVGFGRTNYQAIAAQSKKHTDGVLATFGYEFNGLTLSVDGGYAKTKFINTPKKENRYFVSPGFQYQVTDLSSVYGNYKYERVKKVANEKTKYNGFLLGADYKLHKQVLTYVEGKYLITKEYNAQGNSKVKDKAIGVGLRVFF